jgi:hypothetical protein
MRSAVHLALSGDYQLLASEKYAVSLSSSVALEVYSNTKPHNLKTANLQKGLVFVYNGLERVGEGTGFGFPVLVYPKETFFSSSSTVHVAQTAHSIRIRKEFCMDRTARNKIGNVYLENRKARALMRYLTDLYQKKKHMRFLPLKEFFVNMGIESTFVKATPIGRLPVTYDVTDCGVHVKVDFSHLQKRHPQKVFVLNEQSASFFRKYSDEHHAKLIDKQIGAWDAVGSDWACLTDLQGRVGYRLWGVDGSVLRRGRETMKNCMDWVGLDYEVDPYRDVFEYKIEILGVRS